ncbi:hypothetical protein ACJA3J_12395 [Halobacillus sp. SY10]|uniref:Uncharacterized protein n=1 Tax=Halobacillus aidingensis TaxID=240303 RepID=A0A1H0M1A6_HALAD|nr:hypothetical protein [Halobacillus aidingensis]SDO74175.1 hypothetical protein SAMN05421677_107193 [Halobacillus aidingensis]
MAKQKKSFIKKWWFWGVVILVVFAAAQGGGEEQDQAEAEPEGTPVEEVEAASTEAEETSTEENEASAEEETEEPIVEETEEEVPAENDTVKVSTGMHEVGTDIEPGLYKSEGSVYYWERLAGFSGEFDDIIANGNPQGQEYVEVKESDTAFSTQGTGSWTLIDDTYAPETQTSFGDGTYLVGKDIEPGTYKSESGGGYWARLSGFSGELDTIIANDNPGGSSIVEIQESDRGFQTWGNGEWTKVE